MNKQEKTKMPATISMITASLPSDSASWHLKSSAEMLNSFTSRAMVPFESAIPIAMEKARE
jgi:hypothetical protein